MTDDPALPKSGRGSIECGILAFSSKSRVGGTGVPFLSRGRPPGVVHTKARRPPSRGGKDPPRTQDCWAKVRAVGGEGGDEGSAWELVEILGPVGDAFVEQTVRLCVHRIQPCKYPPELTALAEDRDVAERHSDADADAGADNVDGATGRRFDAYTFDGPGTTDMDDALSYEPPGGPGRPARLGIHVTDTTLLASSATQAASSDVLYEWARERASSAYPSPMVRGPSRRPVHMLPGNLGSLVATSTPRFHPCISLVLELEHGPGGAVTVTGTSVVPSSRVTIVENAEYARMPAACPEMHAALAALAGTSDPAEAVAWAMVYYNTTFAAAFAVGTGGGRDPIYRVLEDGDGTAGARYSRDAGAGHSAFGGRPYVHMTSPMRRFADLHNQRVFKGMLAFALPRSPVDLDALNARMDAVRAFHREDAVACLAYACRDRPRRVVVEAVRERGDDGDDDGRPTLSVRLALVQDGECGGGERVGSFRLPLHDSYYAEPLAQKLRDGGRHEVELHGVVRQGRAQLRIRLMDEVGCVDIGGVERKVGHRDGQAS